jgi:hypothetical protein
MAGTCAGQNVVVKTLLLAWMECVVSKRFQHGWNVCWSKCCGQNIVLSMDGMCRVRRDGDGDGDGKGEGEGDGDGEHTRHYIWTPAQKLHNLRFAGVLQVHFSQNMHWHPDDILITY